MIQGSSHDGSTEWTKNPPERETNPGNNLNAELLTQESFALGKKTP